MANTVPHQTQISKASMGNEFQDDSDILNTIYDELAAIRRALGCATLGAGAGPLVGSKTWDPASTAKDLVATTTLTVTGAAIGDFVLASCSIDLATLELTAYVSAADTVTLVLSNNTGGTIDLASATFKVVVIPQGAADVKLAAMQLSK